VNKKHITIFLIFAFGISWLFSLVIFLTGQVVNSPELIPGTGITLAFVLTATGYMWGPALAHILTRLVTRSEWKDLWLKPYFKDAWKYLLAGWFIPGLLTILGSALFFLILPSQFDPELPMITNQLQNAGAQISPLVVILSQTAIALVISAPVNMLATFGEEFGWRGFLLPSLLPLGKRKALIISSIIWGVWHWPVVLMGHNYGLAYTGYPWLGLILTVWFTLSIGIYFGWLSIKGKSIWPAVLAHGSLNGLASIGMLFIKGSPQLLIGPSPAGLVGVLPFTLLSLWLMFRLKE
jgi:membrane protease YdiL (CAAX protease family)